jgi:hypothetical protein
MKYSYTHGEDFIRLKQVAKDALIKIKSLPVSKGKNNQAQLPQSGNAPCQNQDHLHRTGLWNKGSLGLGTLCSVTISFEKLVTLDKCSPQVSIAGLLLSGLFRPHEVSAHAFIGTQAMAEKYFFQIK